MEYNHICIVCGEKFPERAMHFSYIKHKGYRRIKKGKWTCDACWQAARAAQEPDTDEPEK